MKSLELVRAGAGSGKTTDLCRTVTEAVADGLDPARILATTFTKKAAAELKGRIQAQLLSVTDGQQGAHRNADRLELAAIGTVHSVAHQLISRYAIEMGLSPRLEVMTELAGERALSDLLGRIPLSAWQPLAACAERLGINDLHQRILKLLAAKRGNTISNDDFTTHMAASADRVCELLLPSGGLAAETPLSLLHDLADEALTNINALVNDNQKNTKGARQKLRQLKSKQIPLWASYLEASRIAAGKKSGADGMLDALRNHAAQVRQNPILQDDIREFSSLLGAETIRLETHYADYKMARGLVDFTDLEIHLLQLLQDDAVAARLAEDFDLVLVDEFQDTNPLQLAIFQQLRRYSPRSRWVGDPKQAIYGFRDTDPALVDNIWNNMLDAARTELPNNHRSQRGLVQLVGELFEPIFGADAKQTPQKPAAERGVERWIFQTKNQKDDATSLACGVAKLKNEGVRFGDIVVLERTNRLLEPMAAAFDELGIPYLLESPGLLSTREGALLLAGLRLVADRRDSLAAATILHLMSNPEQETPDWIVQRLQAVSSDHDGETSGGARHVHIPWSVDARFARIERIDHTRLSPTAIVQQVIEAFKLPTLVPTWGDPGRRCSNLDSMLRHTREYEELAFDSGQSATLSGLILHLEQLGDNALDWCYPPQGHDAVTLMTYHSAKGLEWPVVILSGLNSNSSPKMWSPVITGGGEKHDLPLDGRTLRAWTWPFGMTDGEFAKLRTGSGLEKDALASTEGEERSAREREENLRVLYVGCTRARQKLVFAHRTGNYAWLEQLTAVDSVLDPSRDDGEYALDGIETSLVLRRLHPDMVDDCRFETRQQERWFSLPDRPESEPLTARFHSPSRAVRPAEDTQFVIEVLPGPPHFPTNANKDQYAAIGDAVHSYLASLPSMTSCDEPEKERVAERCLAAFGVTGVFSPAILVSSGERFRQWVEENFAEAQWCVEVAASGARSGGGAWNGTIDLLLQLPNGEVVVIDHKSAPIRRDYCETKAQEFTGQLAAYSEALMSNGHVIHSSWIHFPLAGALARRG